MDYSLTTMPTLKSSPTLDQIKKEGYAQDREGKERQMRALSEEFESVLWLEVLKSMKKTVHKNEMFHGGAGEDMFEDMKYQEMAKDMARNGNSGLSNIMMQQFTRALDAEDKAKQMMGATAYTEKK